jgi:Tfp pilus assembly protein PilV
VKQPLSHQTGLSLVEVIIATSIISVFLVTLVSVYNLYLTLSLSNIKKVEATFLAEEGIEVLRTVRDESWDGITAFTSGVPYDVVFSGGNWQATTTINKLDGLYERRIVLDDVMRNGSSDIVESGGINDPDTKKITVTVSWSDKNATTTKVIYSYMTNLFDIE